MAVRLLRQLGGVGGVKRAGHAPREAATAFGAARPQLGTPLCNAASLDTAGQPAGPLLAVRCLGLPRIAQLSSLRGISSGRYPAGMVPVPWATLSQSRGLKAVARDPDRPKRPPTPWLRFLQDFREQRTDLKSSPKTLFASASSQWKALPAPEKKKWEAPYEIEKKSYEAAFKAYVDSGKKAAWERPPDKPKRPVTSFLQFTMDYRAKHPHLKGLEGAKLAAAVWKQMPPSEKIPYEQRYQAAKLKYAADMKEYAASGKEEAWKAKVGIKEKEDAAAKKQAEAATKKEAAAKKKEAAMAKKKALAQKKKEVAAKKKEAAAKKKEAATKKAAAKKKEAAAKQKEVAAKTKEAKAVEKEAKAAPPRAAATTLAPAAAAPPPEAKRAPPPPSGR